MPIILLIFGCGTPTPEEHCRETCRFYSDCDEALEPLEDTCISSCMERFANAAMVTTICTRAAPRHPTDRNRSIPSLLDTVIEAGQCTIDQGCPPEMPDPNAEDPCRGIELACLDALTPEQLCYRFYDVANYDCSVSYQRCFDRMMDPNVCQTDYNDCSQRAYMSLNQCME